MRRMEINEIRRRNLRALLEVFLASGGKKKDFAELVGIEPPQLSHINSEDPSRNIGDIIARRIEGNLQLNRGWLDVSQSVFPSAQRGKNGKIILTKLTTNSSTGQMNSGSFNLIKLSQQDFIGDAKLMDTYPSVVTQIDIEEEYAKSMFGGRDSSALRIHTFSGDTMLGTVNPGEVVVLDITVDTVFTDGIYLFEFGKEIHLKRLQRVKNDLTVICDNNAYEKWTITESEKPSLNLIGFLIGKWDMTYTRLG